MTTRCAGDVAVSSADGFRPDEPLKRTLVARTADRQQGRIIEGVVDDGTLRTTTLTRRADTAVLDAADDAHSFSGSGTATLDARALSTEQCLADPSGTRRARLVASLRTVTEAEDDQRPASLVTH